MDDSIIVLSSDDESTPNVEVKKESVKSRDPENGDKIGVPNKKPKLMSKEETNADCIPSVDIDLSQPESPEPSVFTDFIASCYRLDNSSTMKKIVNDKLRKYYSLLIPEYRRSEQFYVLIERKEAEMIRAPSHLFRHLKELIDELKSHRSDKIAKAKDKVSNKFVRKLCKALELLQRKIKKLEEKEVDWDDDNDSSYIQLQRYRERMIKVYAKLQEVEGETKTSFRRKISFSGTQFPSVNRAIEKFVNAKGEFPDYYDIHDLLKKTYTSEGIEISTDKLKSEAKAIFVNIGEQLQKQRQCDYWDVHSYFLQDAVDPADDSPELCSALNENRKKYGARIDEIINTFAEKPVKSQCTSEDGSSSGETNQRKEKVKQENQSLEDDENYEKRRKLNDLEIGKEEELSNKDNENGGSDDSNDDDDDEEDEEDEGDKDSDGETKQKTETVEDILNDIGEEPAIDNTKEDLFVYCGPVSSPGLSDDVTYIDSSPSLPSPGFDISSTNKSEVDPSDLSNDCFNARESKDEPKAGCSEWGNVLGVESWVTRQQQESGDLKADLKLKDLSRSLPKSSSNAEHDVLD